jgi:hypothetical protein
LSFRRIILALFCVLFSRILCHEPCGSWLCPESTQNLWGAVDTLRPVEDRCATQWGAYPSGNRWDCFDDTTANEDTNYVYTTGTAIREGWGHSNFTAGNIDSVRLTIRHRSPATAGTRQVIFGRMYYAGEGFWYWCTNDAGTDTINLISDYTDSSITWLNDPYDGAPWTQEKLNSTSMAWVFESHSVGTKPDSFGLDSGTATYNNQQDKVEAMKFNTGTNNSGLLDYLRTLIDDATPNGSIKMAVYTDSGGYPDDLLWGDNTGQSITDSWNSTQVSGVELDANTDYWLCYKMNTSNGVRYITGAPAASHRWRQGISGIYDSTWETDTNPGYWTNYNNAQYVMKGAFQTPDNRVTQSFITVFYSPIEAAGKARERRIRFLQEANE